MQRTSGFMLRSGLLLACFFSLCLTPSITHAAPAAEWSSRYFPETGQDVAGPFLSYFDQHGGLAQFGYPLTPVRWEDSYQVQYFERQRFEYHPEKAATEFEVQLGRLGSILTIDAGRNFTSVGDSGVAGNRWFGETGHNLGGRFLQYWQANGGLPIYGLPISEEIKEVSNNDGKEYIVQYFERARFEFHPENTATYDVLLGRLGYDYLLKRDGKAPEAASVNPPPQANTKAAAPTATPTATGAKETATSTATGTATPTATATATPTASDPGGFQTGMNLTGWEDDSYSSKNGEEAINNLDKSRIGWVSLLTTWYQNDRWSTNIAPDGNRTPSDASMRAAIRQAHSLGMKVTIKPHVDNYDGAWRGHIQPSDLNGWFASYKNMILHYAQLAAEEKVEQLVVGTELYTINTSQDTAQWWRPIIAAIRQVYSGKLTYGANWAKQNSEFGAITWWDAVDYIGIDGYFPLSTVGSPSLDQLKAGWESYTDNYGQTYHWMDEIKAVHEKFNKPVVFVEIGYSSTATGAAVYDIPQTNWADQGLQVRAYQAMFEVWSAYPWWRGVYPWNWDLNPNAGGPDDPNMILNNKPAMQTISDWYGKLADK